MVVPASWTGCGLSPAHHSLVYNQCLVPDVHFSGVITSPPLEVGRGRKADSHFTAEKIDSDENQLTHGCPTHWFMAELDLEARSE